MPWHATCIQSSYNKYAQRSVLFAFASSIKLGCRSAIISSRFIACIDILVLCFLQLVFSFILEESIQAVVRFMAMYIKAVNCCLAFSLILLVIAN